MPEPITMTYDMSKLAVNADWATGKTQGEEIVIGDTTYYYGITAFSNMDAAIAAVTDTLPVSILAAGSGSVASTDTDEGTQFTVAGTYNINGTEWTKLGYLQANPSKQASATRYVLNVVDSNLVMTKPQLRGSSDLNITGSHVDFAIQASASCGYLFAFKDSTVTITNSVVGFDVAQGNSTGVDAGEESTVGTNGEMKSIIYGTFTAKNSTIFTFGGDTKNNAFAIYDKGLGDFTASVLYANQITIGDYENRTDRDTVGRDGEIATLKLNNSKIIDNNGEVHGMVVGDDKDGKLVMTNGSSVNYAGSTITVNTNGSIEMDATSQIKVKSMTNSGTITVDMTGATASSYTLIDASAASDYGTYQFATGADNGYVLSVVNNDLVATKIDTTKLAVNADWAGTATGTEVLLGGTAYYFGYNAFANMADAAAAAPTDAACTITVGGTSAILASSNFYGTQNVTITGDAAFSWNDWMFIARGGKQDGVTDEPTTVTFSNATIICGAGGDGDDSIHISGAENGSSSKGYGKLVITDKSDVTTKYVIDKNILTVDKGSSFTVTVSMGVAGRPATETLSGNDDTAYLNIDGGTVNVYDNGGSEGWGLTIGNEGKGEVNLTDGGVLNAININAEAKSTINVTGASELKATKTFTNEGVVNFGTKDAAFSGTLTGSINAAGTNTGYVNLVNGALTLGNGQTVKAKEVTVGSRTAGTIAANTTATLTVGQGAVLDTNGSNGIWVGGPAIDAFESAESHNQNFKLIVDGGTADSGANGFTVRNTGYVEVKNGGKLYAPDASLRNDMLVTGTGSLYDETCGNLYGETDVTATMTVSDDATANLGSFQLGGSGESRANRRGTINVDNATLTASTLKINAKNSDEELARGVVNVNNGTLTATTLTNNGEVNVTGTSKVSVGTFTGDLIVGGTAATTLTTDGLNVSGGVKVTDGSTVTLNGDGFSFTGMFSDSVESYNEGTHTGYTLNVEDAALFKTYGFYVNAGSTVNASNVNDLHTTYFNVYGGTMNVTGGTAGTKDDYLAYAKENFNVTGTMNVNKASATAATLNVWAAKSGKQAGTFVATDAYVQARYVTIGSETKSDKYYASGDNQTAVMTLTNSELHVNNVAGETADSTFTIGGASTTGILNLVNSQVTSNLNEQYPNDANMTISVNGSVNMDATSSISVTNFTNNGTITVDMTGATEASYKLIDASAASDYGTYQFATDKDNGYVLSVVNNDLVATKIDTTKLAVNADWAGTATGTKVTLGGTTYYFGYNAFANMADAAAAAPTDAASTILVGGTSAILASSNFYGTQNVTITGDAAFSWNNWMFIARGGKQDGVTADPTSVTFSGATISCGAGGDGDDSIHISGAENGSASKGYGKLVITENSDVTTKYVIDKNILTVDKGSSFTVTVSMGIAGRPASETISGNDDTAYLNIDGGTVNVYDNGSSEGWGLTIGNEGKGEVNLTNGGVLNAININAKDKSTINVTGASELKATKTFTNEGVINFGTKDAEFTGTLTGSINATAAAYTGAVNLVNGALTLGNGQTVKAKAVTIGSRTAGTIDANTTATLVVGQGAVLDTNGSNGIWVGAADGELETADTNSQNFKLIVDGGTADSGANGFAVRNTGYVEVKNGGYLEAPDAAIRNNMLITGTNSVYTETCGNLYGETGVNAVMTVENGATANLGSFQLGGSGASRANRRGTLDVNGGTVTASTFVINAKNSDEANARGEVNVNDGTLTATTLTNNGEVNVTGGTNTLSIGSLTGAGLFNLTGATLSGGTVTGDSTARKMNVTGTSVITNAANVDLGHNGTLNIGYGLDVTSTNLTISGGASLNSGEGIYLGSMEEEQAAGSYVVTVTGTGSKLTNGGNGSGLYLRQDGKLVVKDGGYFYAPYADLKGSVEVDNATYTHLGQIGGGANIRKGGSLTLTNSATATFGGTLNIGVSDTGAISLENNSTLTVATIYIGENGTVSKDFSSSISFSGTWTNTGTITVDMTGATESQYLLVDNTGSTAMELANYGTVTITDGWTTKVVDNDLYAVKKNYVCQIGDDKYETVQEAVDAAGTTAATITMIANADVSATSDGYGIKIAAGQNITLDLNGYTIEQTWPNASTSAILKNSGTLTLQDSSEGKTGKMVAKGEIPSSWSYANNVISNYGTLTVNSGTYENKTNGIGYAIDNYNGVTTIYGGDFTTEKTCLRNGMFDFGDNTLNIYGGNITSKNGYGIMTQETNENLQYTSTVNIYGGTIASYASSYNLAYYGYKLATTNNEYTNITGGTFIGDVAFGGKIAKECIDIYGGNFGNVYSWGVADGFIRKVDGYTLTFDLSNDTDAYWELPLEAGLALHEGSTAYNYTVVDAKAKITDADGKDYYCESLEFALTSDCAAEVDNQATITLLSDSDRTLTNATQKIAIENDLTLTSGTGSFTATGRVAENGTWDIYADTSDENAYTVTIAENTKIVMKSDNTSLGKTLTLRFGDDEPVENIGEGEYKNILAVNVNGDIEADQLSFGDFTNVTMGANAEVDTKAMFQIRGNFTVDGTDGGWTADNAQFKVGTYMNVRSKTTTGRDEQRTATFKNTFITIGPSNNMADDLKLSNSGDLVLDNTGVTIANRLMVSDNSTVTMKNGSTITANGHYANYDLSTITAGSTLNVQTNSSLTFAKDLSNAGTVAMDYTATITANAFSGATGTITVDMTGADEALEYKLVDASAASSYGTISITDGWLTKVENNDLIAYKEVLPVALYDANNELKGNYSTIASAIAAAVSTDKLEVNADYTDDASYKLQDKSLTLTIDGNATSVLNGSLSGFKTITVAAGATLRAASITVNEGDKLYVDGTMDLTESGILYLESQYDLVIKDGATWTTGGVITINDEMSPAEISDWKRYKGISQTQEVRALQSTNDVETKKSDPVETTEGDKTVTTTTDTYVLNLTAGSNKVRQGDIEAPETEKQEVTSETDTTKAVLVSPAADIVINNYTTNAEVRGDVIQESTVHKITVNNNADSKPVDIDLAITGTLKAVNEIVVNNNAGAVLNGGSEERGFVAEAVTITVNNDGHAVVDLKATNITIKNATVKTLTGAIVGDTITFTGATTQGRIVDASIAATASVTFADSQILENVTVAADTITNNGALSFRDSNIFSSFVGGTGSFDWDLATAGTAYVNDYSLLTATGDKTITVNALQTAGTYVLAGKATTAAGNAFTLKGTSTDLAITVGGGQVTDETNGRIYTLAVNSSDQLTLTVAKSYTGSIFYNPNWTDNEYVTVTFRGAAYSGTVGQAGFYNDLATAISEAGTTKTIAAVGVDEIGSVQKFMGASTIIAPNDNSDATYSQAIMGDYIGTGTEYKKEKNPYTVEVDGGTFTSMFVAGDNIASAVGENEDDCFISRNTPVTTVINGGRFDKSFVGGSYYGVNGDYKSKANTSLIVKGVNLTINGGSFGVANKARFFAGNASRWDIYTGHTDVNGNITFTINANSAIAFGEHVICGSHGTGRVSGNVNVTVTGLGSNLTFASGAYFWGGCSGDYYLTTNGVRSVVSYVSGERNLTFNEFKGNFAAKVNMFETLTFEDSNINFTGSSLDWREVETWNLDSESTVALGSGKNDFNGDTLNIDLTSWGEVTTDLLTAGDDELFSSFDSSLSVNFIDGGATTKATWNAEKQAFFGGDYALKLSNDGKKVSLMLASKLQS